jgi:hypothetical protein
LLKILVRTALSGHGQTDSVQRVGAWQRADLAELADWVEGLRAAAQKAREDGNLTLAGALDVTRFEVYERYLSEELHRHNAQVDGPEDKTRSNSKWTSREVAPQKSTISG